ncbi:hypothetical protein GOV06_04245 [Candidatus Woesearchaeota archaeon]|nr:hypothetical protein [Candidatus Woesearchaeota archaeon]
MGILRGIVRIATFGIFGKKRSPEELALRRKVEIGKEEKDKEKLEKLKTNLVKK